MPISAQQAIEDYANCMFREERLADPWIESCAAYLRAVFGERLLGATVLDYAFGRGNWSVAFRRAGAARVIAVDASADNVARFRRHCREQAIDGVDVVQGNAIEAPIRETADIVWLYGILHHVAPDDGFLARIAEMAPGANALFYVYAYDKGSLRQFVVETARRLTRFETEEEFRRHALCLTRPARLRARDDLMAPFIRWYDARDLAALLARRGLVPVARHAGFDAFLAGRRGDEPAEFAPHQWLCRRGAEPEIEIADPPCPSGVDLAALEALAAALESADLDLADRRRLGLGLFNAHFGALAADGGPEAAICEDFLHLYHALASRGALPGAASPAAPYVAAIQAALAGETARAGAPLSTPLARRLTRTRVRL